MVEHSLQKTVSRVVNWLADTGELLDPTTWSREVAVDLGATESLVLVRGRGLVVEEPSLVVVDSIERKTVAIGSKAERMSHDLPPGHEIIKPLQYGEVKDWSHVEELVRHLIRHAIHPFPRLLPTSAAAMSVPHAIQQHYTVLLTEVLLDEGIREAVFVDEHVAAAIGAGIRLPAPVSRMIVDIGEEITEAAVLSFGGIVLSTSVRVGSEQMADDIVAYVKKEHHLLIGENIAERARDTAGTAIPIDPEVAVKVEGRDIATGLPRTVEITSREIRNAIQPSLKAIVETVKGTIERTPPDLVPDILARGIILVGGGALLEGLDFLLSQETRFPTWVASDPGKAAVRGAAELIRDVDLRRNVLASGIAWEATR